MEACSAYTIMLTNAQLHYILPSIKVWAPTNAVRINDIPPDMILSDSLR